MESDIQSPNKSYRNSIQKIDDAPEALLEPYYYLESSQGKGIRDVMIDSFNNWLKVPETILKKIKLIIRMLHTASLLIDDIEDNSKMRRGIPVAHHIYGVPNVLNTSNYIYFLALQEVNRLGNAHTIDVFTEELLNLHVGQGWDILWRDSSTCPTEDQYKDMVIGKTGGLFRLATRLMQTFSDDKRNFIPLLNNLGLYYQIRDDYLNLKSGDYMLNKSYCEDITEGKFSFPIIHSINKNPSDTRLLSILRRRTSNVEPKKHALDYMESTGSFVYTLKILNDIEKKILDQINELGGCDDLVKIIDYLKIN